MTTAIPALSRNIPRHPAKPGTVPRRCRDGCQGVNYVSPSPIDGRRVLHSSLAVWLGLPRRRLRIVKPRRLLTIVRRRIVPVVRRHGIDLAGEGGAPTPAVTQVLSLITLRGPQYACLRQDSDDSKKRATIRGALWRLWQTSDVGLTATFAANAACYVHKLAGREHGGFGTIAIASSRLPGRAPRLQRQEKLVA